MNQSRAVYRAQGAKSVRTAPAPSACRSDPPLDGSRSGSLDDPSSRRRYSFATSRNRGQNTSAPPSLRPLSTALSSPPRSTVTTRQRQRDAEIRRLQEHTRALGERLARRDDLGGALRHKSGPQLAAVVRQLQLEKEALQQCVSSTVDSLRRQCRGDSSPATATAASAGGAKGAGEANCVTPVGDGSSLLQQLQQLERLVLDHQRVQQQFADKIAECERLAGSASQSTSARSQHLDRQLRLVQAENGVLGEQSRALSRQVAAIDQTVDSRCAELDSSIGRASRQWQLAQRQVCSLQGQVRCLELMVQQMRLAGEERQRLLEQREVAQAELHQLTVTRSTGSGSGSQQQQEEEAANSSHVRQLESQIRELEKRAAAQQLQQEELLLEVTALKQAASSQSATAPPDVTTAAAHRAINNNSSSRLRSDDSVDTDGDAATSSDVGTDVTGAESPPPPPSARATATPAAGSSRRQLDSLMEQMERDNRLLQQLDRCRSGATNSATHFQPRHQLSCSSASVSPTPHASRLLAAAAAPLPPLQLLYQQQLPVGTTAASEAADLLSVPGRGTCRVYIARFRYDPLRDSPNASAEDELALSAGDYVLVWLQHGAQPHVSGFLRGELLSGARGLVPSNYVHQLCGQQLVEFLHQVATDGLAEGSAGTAAPLLPSTLHPPAPVDPATRPPNETTVQWGQPDIDSAYFERQAPPPDQQAPPSLNAVEDGDCSVPPPQCLTLQRRMSRSVVVGWRTAVPPPPHSGLPPVAVDCYHVYVNGLLRCRVRAGERLRALLESVDMSRVHRVCVRSVVTCGAGGVLRCSPDPACTLLIGDNAPVAPTCVRAVDVTATAALIAWLPSDSSRHHSICVNNVQVCRVGPGVFRHRISGIVPGTVCRVTVNALGSPATGGGVGGSVSAVAPLIEFRTPTSCVPEPPLDVQCELGPRRGTLLVTWLPVTISTRGGTSNGAPVTGYAVYADGQRVAELDSPTGDHTVLDLAAIDGFRPRYLTVRTKSLQAGVSRDSQPVAVPLHCYQPEWGEQGGAGEHEGAQSIHHQQHPQQQQQQLSARVPQIEITRDSVSEALCSLGDASEPDYTPQLGSGAAAWQQRFYQQQQQRATGGHSARHTSHQHQSLPRHPVSRQARPQQQQWPRGRGATRLFVALFDYDPPTMSPNPDACDSELAFAEGQLIRVYGDKDADGFFWGEPVEGEASVEGGLVPCNMVSEVQMDEADQLYQQQQYQQTGQQQQQYQQTGQQQYDEECADSAQVAPSDGAATSQQHQQQQHDRWGDIYCSQPTRRMVALYDYDPRELSPNVDSEVELSFRTGDLILVLGDMDDDGFYMAEINGSRGLVPSNFLTEAPLNYDHPQQGRSDRRVPAGPGVHGPPLPPRHRHPSSSQQQQQSHSNRLRRATSTQHQQQQQQHSADRRFRDK